jgi:hypothetical protein
VKIDTDKNVQWSRKYGGPLADNFLSVIETSDGFAVAGVIMPAGQPPQYHIYAVKTNTLGDTIWTKRYGSSESDWGNCIRQTNDAGFLITGSTYVNSYNDCYLIKTDMNGNSGCNEFSTVTYLTSANANSFQPLITVGFPKTVESSFNPVFTHKPW